MDMECYILSSKYYMGVYISDLCPCFVLIISLFGRLSTLDGFSDL